MKASAFRLFFGLQSERLYIDNTVIGQVTSSKFKRYCRVAARYDKRAAALLGFGLKILLAFVAWHDLKTAPA
jgi:hypothetical protein